MLQNTETDDVAFCNSNHCIFKTYDSYVDMANFK